jgi:hypothetical protein
VVQQTIRWPEENTTARKQPSILGPHTRWSAETGCSYHTILCRSGADVIKFPEVLQHKVEIDENPVWNWLPVGGADAQENSDALDVLNSKREFGRCKRWSR